MKLITHFSKFARIKPKKKNGKISIHTYVAILEKAANGDLRAPDVGSQRLIDIALFSLGDEGLLNIRPNSPCFLDGHVFITPKGVIELSNWKNSIKKEGILYRAGDVILKFLWLAVGAICASTTQIISALIN